MKLIKTKTAKSPQRTGKLVAAKAKPRASRTVAAMSANADVAVKAEVTAPAVERMSDEAYTEHLLAASEILPAQDEPSVVAECDALAETIVHSVLVAIEPESVAAVAAPSVRNTDTLNTDSATMSNPPVIATSGAPDALADVAVALPAQCLMRDAVDLRQQLLRWLDTATVTIDVGAVERIDTAAMQVLLAFVRDLHSRKHTIQWRNINSAFAEAACSLGLETLLGVPAMEAA